MITTGDDRVVGVMWRCRGAEPRVPSQPRPDLIFGGQLCWRDLIATQGELDVEIELGARIQTHQLRKQEECFAFVEWRTVREKAQNWS